MSIGEILQFLKSNHEAANAISAMASATIAFVAFLISLLSVFFTWRALKLQRTHNSMSVRPLPYITVGDYEDSIYVKIRNNGTGPLIVKSLTVSGGCDPSEPLIDQMPTLPDRLTWTNFTGSIEGRSISVGGEMILLELSNDTLSSEFPQTQAEIRKTLSTLSLTLDYTDVYGNKLSEYSRDLTWFGRTLAAA